MSSRASLVTAAVLAILTAAAFPTVAFAQPTIVSGSGYSITFNGNQQAFFSNTWDGTSQQAPNNIALSGQGSTAFASSQFGSGVHLTEYANDGVYGNNRSWLSDLSGTQAYVGIAFPAALSLSSIAWGRDNGRNSTATPGGGGDTPPGQHTDRSRGTYTLQFTTVASPGTSTLTGDWTTLGTITLPLNAAGSFSPWFRHEYDIRTSAGEPIAGVTGFQIITLFFDSESAQKQVIDEIEIYRATYWTGGSAVWSSTTAWQTAAGGGTSTTPFDGDPRFFAASTASTQAVALGDADRSARSLSFTTADPVSLTAGGINRTLTLGWAGDLTTASGTSTPTLTMAASAGSVTIGSQSAGQQVPLALNASQTWTNDSVNTLTVHNAVSRIASDTTTRTLTVGGSGNSTINGPIANGGAAGILGLTKSGSGTLTLTESNSYTGATNVSGGALYINGSLATGAVTVQSGGRLGGSGSIGGAVTINSGGVLAPGNSIESLTTGALSFLSGSTYEYEIDSSALLSVGADFTKALGDLSLAGTVDLSIIDLAGSPTAFNQSTTFSLINYTGSWNNGLFTVGGSEVADGGTFTVGLNTWQLNYAATSGGSNFPGDHTSGSFINIVVVPEPGALAIAAIGIACGAAALRRRCQS